MKISDYALIGGAGLVILYFVTQKDTSGGPSLLEKGSANLGSALGAVPPQIFFPLVGSAAQSFWNTSINYGFSGGEAFDNALKPAAQVYYETHPLPLPVAQPTADQWNQTYRAAVDPLANIPVLGNISAVWHNALVGSWEW